MTSAASTSLNISYPGIPVASVVKSCLLNTNTWWWSIALTGFCGKAICWYSNRLLMFLVEPAPSVDTTTLLLIIVLPIHSTNHSSSYIDQFKRPNWNLPANPLLDKKEKTRTYLCILQFCPWEDKRKPQPKLPGSTLPISPPVMEGHGVITFICVVDTKNRIRQILSWGILCFFT